MSLKIKAASALLAVALSTCAFTPVYNTAAQETQDTWSSHMETVEQDETGLPEQTDEQENVPEQEPEQEEETSAAEPGQAEPEPEPVPEIPQQEPAAEQEPSQQEPQPEEAEAYADEPTDEVEGLTDEDSIPYAVRSLKDVFAETGNYPDEASQTILTSFSLIFIDGQGGETTEPTLNSEARLSFSFAIPEDVRSLMGGGEYYIVELPPELRVANQITLPLVDDGVELGTAVINADGTIVLSFTETVKTVHDIEGSIAFTGRLNPDSIIGTGPTTIRVPNEDKLEPILINVRPDTTAMLDKTGWPTRDGVTWELVLNKSMRTLTNPLLTETLPEGTYAVSAQVYVAQVDLYGQLTGEETLLDPALFTLDTATGSIQFHTELSAALRVELITRIEDTLLGDNGGSFTFINTALLSAPEIDTSITAEATVDAQYTANLYKEAAGYSSKDHSFTWRVKYNWGERTVENGTLTDTFDTATLALLEDSFTAYIVTFDEFGDPVYGEEFIDYTVDKTETGFVLALTKPIEHALVIEYKTRVTGEVVTDKQYTNTVTDEGGRTATAGNWARQQMVTKTHTVNHIDRTITWTVRINVNRYTIRDLELQDSFTAGLTLASEVTLVDEGTGYVLQEGTDYTLDMGELRSFTLRLTGSAYSTTDATLRMTYTTDFDVQKMEGTSSLRNTANVWWTGEDDERYSASASAYYTPNQRETDNGTKGGSYNAVTKQITWTVTAGYSRSGFADAVLTDTIEEGQEYVAGSLRIYAFTVTAASSEPVRGAQLTGSDLAAFTIEEPNEQNGYVLTIQIPDGIARYWFEFETTVEGTVIQAQYSNTAVIANSTTDTKTLTASVNVANGGSLAGKSGQIENDGHLWWNVVINPSQSTLADVVLTDTPCDNQLIDMASLAIYETEVDADGNIYITDTEYAAYTASYTQGEDGTRQMQVMFHETLERPYILRYRIIILAEQSGEITLSNHVSINGYNEETVEGGHEKELTMDVSSGVGVIIGRRSGYVVQKLDDITREPIAGAGFTIYSTDGETVMGPEIFTSENGIALFTGIPYGSYLLVETTVPIGYTVDPDLAQGVEITIDGESGDTIFEAMNSPNAATLLKTDEEGEPLENAVFALEHYDNETGEWLEIAQYTTDGEGAVTAYALPDGAYRWRELSAPGGYYRDPERVYEFEVAREDEDGSYSTMQTGPVVNQQIDARLYKIDGEGTPLANAVFAIELFNEQDGNWQLHNTLQSDREGVVAAIGLAPGLYRIYELAAPVGYELDETAEPIEFTITDEELEPIELGTAINTAIVPAPEIDPGGTQIVTPPRGAVVQGVAPIGRTAGGSTATIQKAAATASRTTARAGVPAASAPGVMRATGAKTGDIGTGITGTAAAASALALLLGFTQKRKKAQAKRPKRKRKQK